jgi:hypothetical protein
LEGTSTKGTMSSLTTILCLFHLLKSPSAKHLQHWDC